MSSPPAITTIDAYRACRHDAQCWLPWVRAVVEQHGIAGAGRDVVPGHNATYPTFLCGDVVVKFFGFLPGWRATHAAETSAHALLATDAEIKAPHVVARGVLDEGAWSYLVTERISGCGSDRAPLDRAQRLALAASLGDQVRRIHALRPAQAATLEDLPGFDLIEGAKRSSLPPHLVEQVAAYVESLPPPDPVFVHGDLCAMHAFVDHGALAGIIDWGDACVADRHYELIQIHRSTLQCDTELLRVFLEAYGWTIGPDFAKRALGHALNRQASGIVQHLGMDVFEPVAERLPLRDIATLDELAIRLFGRR